MSAQTHLGDAFFCRGAPQPLADRLAPPPSKSVAARALILASLSPGATHLPNMPDASDTRELVQCLRVLGVRIEPGAQPNAVIVHGGWRTETASRTFPVGTGGTTVRFLVPVLCGIPGTHRLVISAALARRPHNPLWEQAKAVGVRVDGRTNGDGTLSVELRVPDEIPLSPRVFVDTRVSSQFLTGWLLRASAWPGGITLQTPNGRVSDGYLLQTAALLRAFGIEPPTLTAREYRLAERNYTSPPCLDIPADASAAVYAWGAAAITGGTVTTTGLDPTTPQPDMQVLEVLERLGCTVRQEGDAVTVTGPADGVWTTGIDADLSSCPDGAVLVAFLCARGSYSHRLRGLSILCHKESDRLAVVAESLTRLGASVTLHEDGWTIAGSEALRPARIEPAGDHRIAMAAAVLGLVVPGIVVAEPACVGKSWPGFWSRYARWQSPTAAH